MGIEEMAEEEGEGEIITGNFVIDRWREGTEGLMRRS
jgi:hypothetical protein